MPIENIVAAAELSATTEPVGNCMGASPRASRATPDHYPGAEGKSTTSAGSRPRRSRRASASTSRRNAESRIGRKIGISDGATR
ncbi:hypothetical protein E2P84_27035 [Burkholderia cepacia]|uniref:Uncharacterized protein n=1 Tax=Burkholderia cepacia TaxID=292 RepID=A0AAX2RW09_BURCE|nr:hypothetical protein E2P84_27035 [Burkholderia cepacia]TES97985.1 hypothetical protein E3D36_30740 [Burkholderia cepacia]TEU34529.1 hypothetical protein E3D39_31400 [Burkholderia cepacia]TEU43282.1 hypothetical protein E3D38_30550 [Burkholderia cepacia]TEU52207.1 hypothetical protein E3D37_05990 [Burkholderia cepacia]